MKTNPLPRLPWPLLLALTLLALLPTSLGLADANEPTITNTPTSTETPIPPASAPLAEPSATPIPAEPINLPPDVSETPASLPQPTIAPLPTPIIGGLSLLNRVLLMIVAVAFVLFVGLVVFAIYRHTRGQGG